jgi:hypothetical protein
MKFNKSIIATFVGSAIASVSLGAVASDITPFLKAVAPVAKVSTISGMANQYDAQLGKATFQWANAQNKAPSMAAISAKHQVAYASEYYLNQLTGISAVKNKGIQAVLASVHDKGVGAKIAKYKQEIDGVEVFNREYNIMMDAEFNLVASSGYLASAKSASNARMLSLAFGNPAKAISDAFNDMGGDSASVDLSSQETNAKYEKFNVNSSTADYKVIGEPRTKKVFFEMKGKLEAAYYVELEASSIDSVDSDYYSYVISASSGKVLFKNNLTSHASKFEYRIYADEAGKPWDSPHGNVIPATVDTPSYITAPYLDTPLVKLAHGPISTKDGWLAADATETMGNNVSAYADVVAPDGLTNGDYAAGITADGNFDYAYDDNQAEFSKDNRKAAIVNLFFMNNYLHDDFYDHGFDEVSGNAQASNFERGGEEGDVLHAQVQDNSGMNNANMSTPADGGSPRMQMYLWNKSGANGVDYGTSITSGETDVLVESGVASSLGPNQFADVEGKLVRYIDATSPVNDACETATNVADLAGNIAIIDRGACAFVDKVQNAQRAGAIAVIVANNRDGDAAFRMGGDDSSEKITIPNMMISQNDGTAIYTAMASDDVTVSMFNNGADYKASSWDNGIVAHEWGHYISNRLVGNGSGLSNNQGRSMGEGWGDFHALLLLSSAEDAMIAGNEMFETAYSATSYVANFNTGIRRNPYSTNMDINPLTFKSIEVSAEVHDSGEIWASMLWDSYVALINDEHHTFAEAQSLMKDYLVAGYKMTPIAPTFTEARDAILAAAYVNDPADYTLILAAFARRGMGLGAVSPARFSTDHLGVVESTDMEFSNFTVSAHAVDSNYEGLTSGYCSNDNVLDKGETGTVSFILSNHGSETYEDIKAQVEVVSGQDITFANEGVITFDSLGVTGVATNSPLEFTLNEATTADSIELKITFPDLEDGITEEYSFTTTVNYDFIDKAPVNSSTIDDMEDISTTYDITEHVMGGGDRAMGTGFLDTRFASQLPVGNQYFFINNNGFPSDVSYETKTFTVGYEGDFVVSWFHYADFENTWDGGVVEISVNGSDWADVTDVGGEFAIGYTREVQADAETALSERMSYTGFSAGFETLTFPISQVRNKEDNGLSGSEVKLRFRAVSDTYANRLGWIIDGLKFENITTTVFSDLVAGDTLACDNRLPYVTVSADQTVKEGTSVSMSVEASDPNGDALTYTWTQTSGLSTVLTGADTAEASFTVPLISTSSASLTYTVDVGDGTDIVTKIVTFNIENVLAQEKSSNSSGGSTGIIALLLLPLAMLRRRFK